MASLEPAEEQGNTETEEGTIAVQKKRARRVSFAENTSVHFFDRDEEFETPPDPNKPSSSPVFGKSGENLGFLGDAEANNDSKESSQNEGEEDYEDYEDENDSRSPFFRPLGSPSPGSTFSSATSNDEDNFFGPVSSSFIKPSRLSDSAASDENHDLTMDSTAFSMHFRSLARSDSEGELKTSTRLHLSFEEKTPARDSISSHTGSSMVLAPPKNLESQSSVPNVKLRDGCDSSDMSLVGEYKHRYDYDRLSPGLENLLAEGSKVLHVVSVPNNTVALEPPFNCKLKLSPAKENGTVRKDLSDTENKGTEGIGNLEMVTEAVSHVENELGEVNGGSQISPSHGITYSFPPNASKAQALNLSSPDYIKKSSPGGTTKEKDAFSGLDIFNVASGAPSNLSNVDPQVDCFTAQENHSPLAGSTSFLSAKRRLTILNSGSPSKSHCDVTPPIRQTRSFLGTETETIIHDESTSSIQKSISKLRMLKASPFSSALNAKIDDSNLRSSANLVKTTPLGILLEKIGNVSQVNHVLVNGIDTHPLDIYSEKQLSAAIQRRGEIGSLINVPDGRIETPPKGIKVSSPLALPSQVTWSGEKMQSSLLRSGDRSEGIKAASPSQKTGDKPSFQKNLVDQFCQTSSREVLENELHDDDVDYLPVGEDAPSPNPNPLYKGNVNSFERKRKNADVIDGNGDHIEEIIRVERSPKLQKSGISLNHLNGSNNGTSRNGDKLKHMAEIHKTFLEDTKQLLSPAVDKLNLHMIDKLEHLLDQLQRSKKFQMLLTEIQSQKISDHSSDALHKREAKVKSLMLRVVHEKTKLQLLQAKREKLLKRVQLVRSGIQESEVLKSNCSPPKSGDVPVDDGRSLSFTGNIKDIQEASIDKVAAGRQALEESERRIFELSKAFHNYLKIKGEPSSAETISLVNNHLINRARLRLVRMESQLWVVDHLESRKGHHSIVLNYLDLIIQRLTITINPVSSISISNKLNETNLIKNFADMNACTAFQFVFDAETTRKYVGAPNLAQETQINCSLLGNLLDVLLEIQRARIELQNLIHTSFCSPSVGYLYLQLSFFDYKRGKKTMLTLDMSCLKRGIYPSEVLPCQIIVPVNGLENSPSQSLLVEEVTAAVQNLRVGYTRVIRLCRGISQWFNT